MPNSAILIGNSEYRNAPRLECCRADVLAVEELLIATGKYATITKIEDADADDVKEQLRVALDAIKSPEELFFYFTGHGHAHEKEFFLCPKNFDSKRPHQTGLSETELHTLLRLPDANLVIKVMDACYSGTQLIKADINWLMQQPKDFRNVIQFASCMDSQTSLTGHPLSLFTQYFRAAALSKLDGPVYYTDIVNYLRDEFLDNDSQIPCFVSQHTGREQFVDDAKKLSELRMQIEGQKVASVAAQVPELVPAPSLRDRLEAASAKAVTAELMGTYVGGFFDSLQQGLKNNEFGEFYSIDFLEHADFREDTTRNFIIRVLDQEKRPDNFVTATHTRQARKQNPLYSGLIAAAAVQRYLDPDAYYEEFHLRLNATMPRAQMKVTFTPKFVALQRLTLVVTCAPSIDHCYVFEMLTQHMLQDFGKYDTGGPEISRNWWRLNWTQKHDGVIGQICSHIKGAAKAQLESAEKRLLTPTENKPPEAS